MQTLDTTRTEPFSELADQPICAEVLIEKYAKDGEASVQEVRRRVARALHAKVRVTLEPEHEVSSPIVAESTVPYRVGRAANRR